MDRTNRMSRFRVFVQELLWFICYRIIFRNWFSRVIVQELLRFIHSGSRFLGVHVWLSYKICYGLSCYAKRVIKNTDKVIVQNLLWFIPSIALTSFIVTSVIVQNLLWFIPL